MHIFWNNTQHTERKPLAVGTVPVTAHPWAHVLIYTGHSPFNAMHLID